MKWKVWSGIVGLVGLCGLLLGAGAPLAAEYNITQSMDFTGPYAVVMKPIDDTSKVFVEWWNDEVGSKIGVKLNRKAYDTRYDPAITASLWPGIVSGDKPLAHIGLGGPDVAALMKRLPEDKIPLFLGTGTYGYVWLPNQWVFQPRPTYVHEAAAFFEWAKQHFKKKTLKVAAVSTQGVPAYVDGAEGMENYAKKTGAIEYVGTEWVKMKPESLVSEIMRLSRKKPDYIWIMTNTYQSVGTINAEKELGIYIPVLMSSHNGIQMSALATKDMNVLNGHYDVAGLDPGIDLTIPAAQIYEKYKKKLGIETPWSLMTVQAAIMDVMAFRAIERAVKRVGPDKLTGEEVYKSMYEGPFDETKDFLGLAPTSTWTKEATFPTTGAGVKATTAKDGKHVLVTPNWVPVPNVPKWAKVE
jgi:branched-chain amino acid transport system substrate-binding protein